MIQLFAAAEGPAVHIAPSTVFHIGGVAITNSMLYGWITTVLLGALLIWVARRVTIRPQGGVTQLVEAGAEFITNLVENSFNNPAKGRKYIPFFVTLFFFIMVTNWLGLVPGVGEALNIGGETPLLRPFTADLNATLAMAAITMGMVYTASIREMGGLRKYVRHFFIGSPKNPLYFTIGILEMFTDLTRVFSLALRLFLNVAIGEIVIAVFAYLGHYLAPVSTLPFFLMELFVGALQAFVFTLLAIMYLAIAVNHADEHAAEESHA